VTELEAAANKHGKSAYGGYLKKLMADQS
jgi:hypothetical protein